MLNLAPALAFEATYGHNSTPKWRYCTHRVCCALILEPVATDLDDLCDSFVAFEVLSSFLWLQHHWESWLRGWGDDRGHFVVATPLGVMVTWLG